MSKLLAIVVLSAGLAMAGAAAVYLGLDLPDKAE